MMMASYLIAIALEWIETTIWPQLLIQFITEENMVTSFFECLLLSIFILLVILFLRSQRLGFSFLTKSYKQQFQFKGSQSIKIALTSSLLVIFLTSILTFLYPGALLALPLVISVPVIYLLRLFYKWEMTE
jgi:hypothetical protein